MRKGAWMEEEDILLTKCIEKFGVGKWRRVPFKAGRVLVTLFTSILIIERVAWKAAEKLT